MKCPNRIIIETSLEFKYFLGNFKIVRAHTDDPNVPNAGWITDSSSQPQMEQVFLQGKGIMGFVTKILKPW